MKKICLILALFFGTLFLLAEDDDEKLKLAVMEFEDLSKKLSPQMLSGATEYMRGAFVSTNKYVVIAKERQEKAMIKEMKKESYKSCNDKNCQIPLGQALSADTILRTTISFFGGFFTITSELIDLAKEATVSGAKQNFDGSERSLVAAIDRIVVQIAGTSVAYNIEAMKTQEIQGIKLGGVELDTMPKIEMKEADFDEVNTNLAVSELDSASGVSLDADADVLVQYDKCVGNDQKGKNSPILAINCWKKLASMSEGNPFISQAKKRVAEWEKYIRTKKFADLFEKAKEADKTGQIFPQEAMTAWQNIGREKEDNPYYQTAAERYTSWKQYKAQVNKYTLQLQKFKKQRDEDIAKLKKVLPLKVITDAQKRTVLLQYMEIYAPYYGIEDVNKIIYSMDDATAKQLYGLVYNDYLKKEMAKKCDSGNGAACYISASLIRVVEPAKSLEFFEKSCEKGVVEACLETGKAFYDTKQYEKASKHFYEACGMESPEGCHLAALVTENGYGKEKNEALAGKIYKKACSLEYKASCMAYKKYGYSDNTKQKINVQTPIPQNKQTAQPKKQSENKQTKETYHPYKTAGISLIVVGAVIAAAGVGGFHVAYNKELDNYKKMMETDTAAGYVGNLSKSEYVDKADKYRKNANTFRALEVTSGILGGSLLITGIVLTAIKKDKPRNVSLANISFTPSNDGFYAALGFEF